jgi:hypothetical protein
MFGAHSEKDDSGLEIKREDAGGGDGLDGRVRSLWA